MTSPILTVAEIKRETAALAKVRETLPEALARRRAERIAEKLFARARIAGFVAIAAPTLPAST